MGYSSDMAGGGKNSDTEGPVAVAATEQFDRAAAKLFTEDERAEVEWIVATNPEAGDLIRESGGIRKLRVRLEGTGKSGGARVVYYFHDRERPLFLLDAYPKSKKENLSPKEVAKLRATVDDIKAGW